MGRPRKYTDAEREEIVSKVLASMEKGESFTKACEAAGICKSLFRQWEKADETLYDRYARARAAMMEHWADDIVDIGNETPTYLNAQGVAVTDNAGIQRNRLRIDSRKWLLSKLRPDLYGERVVQEHVGPGGGPVQSVSFSAEQLKGLTDDELKTMKELMAKASKKK